MSKSSTGIILIILLNLANLRVFLFYPYGTPHWSNFGVPGHQNVPMITTYGSVCRYYFSNFYISLTVKILHVFVVKYNPPYLKCVRTLPGKSSK